MATIETIGPQVNSQPLNDNFAALNYGKMDKESIFYDVKDYGATGDGVTDDTTSFQSAINTAYAAGGGTVFCPPGVYLVGDLVMKNNVTLYAFPNPLAYAGSTSSATLKAKSGATYILNVSGVNGFGVYGFKFDGNSKASAGTSSNCGGGWIENCSFVNCSTGVGKFLTAYMHTMLITKCHFYYNTIGVENMVDCKITESFFYSNTNGINLGTGCNANIITNNKIEWNVGAGISAYQCYNSVISDNIFDRNGESGLFLNDCHNTTIGVNVFARNGATTSDSNKKNHMYIAACSNITFTGNVTLKTAINDDGSGAVKPDYCITLSANSYLTFSGNDLTGFVTSMMTQPFANTGVRMGASNLGAESYGNGVFTSSASGSGSVLTIPHGLGYVPSRVCVLPASVAACEIHYISAVDSTNITITFKVAPPFGTNTLVFRWFAE